MNAAERRRKAREQEAKLRLIAVQMLMLPDNGGWHGFRLVHAHGLPTRLDVVWDRAGTRFIGRLDAGVLVELEMYEGRGKA